MAGRSTIKQLEVVSESEIYISSQVHKLYKFDGTEWNSLGDWNPGYNEKFIYNSANEIYAIHNNYIKSTDDSKYNYIAFWNGNEWSNFGNLNTPRPIYNFKIISNTEAYAVGDYTDIDNFRWKSVVKYNGSSWSVIGLGDSNAGTYSGNNSLWVNNENDIYSKYDGYKDAGEKKVKHWNGTSWTILRNYPLDEIDGVDHIHFVSENEIYTNTRSSDNNLASIGFWDGNYWRVLGDIQTNLNTGDFHGSLDFLYVNRNEIYAFGSALKNKETSKYQVAVWDGNSWKTIPNLFANNPVTAASYKDNFLYVGGSFTENYQFLLKKVDSKKVLNTQNFIIEETSKVFPNPVLNTCSFDKTYSQVKVFSVTGKLVHQSKNTSKIDVKNIESGVYFIKLINGQGNFTVQKILKN